MLAKRFRGSTHEAGGGVDLGVRLAEVHAHLVDGHGRYLGPPVHLHHHLVNLQLVCVLKPRRHGRLRDTLDLKIIELTRVFEPLLTSRRCTADLVPDLLSLLYEEGRVVARQHLPPLADLVLTPRTLRHCDSET